MAKKNANVAPSWMLRVAVDDDFRITETMFAKDGSQYEITRRASLKERLSAAKDAANYFDSKMPTLEHHMVTSGANIDKMSDAEIVAALKMMAPLLPVEKSDGAGSDSSEGAEEAGSDSESAVGGPEQQASDTHAEDQEAQP